MDQALSLSHKLFADDITAFDTSVITDTEREYDLQLRYPPCPLAVLAEWEWM